MSVEKALEEDRIEAQELSRAKISCTGLVLVYTCSRVREFANAKGEEA